MQCRQTDASWSYQYFEEHSADKDVEGSEESVGVRVPSEELLIPVKLHSGRLTDARDVVALIQDTDLEKVEEHIDRGDQEKLKQVLENIEEPVGDSNFEDSFKGVFQRGTLPEENIEKIQEFIQNYG